MSKALSLDLRTRVLAAVADGLSHRHAGVRFGVSAASVSRWRAREREQGEPRPKALGGDACTALILSLLEETPDITLEEMRQALAKRGHHFGFGTIQRFFARHAITRKKRRSTRASRTGQTF
jgi:transposase